MGTKTIKGIEVFRVGQWNNTEFIPKDLKDIKRSFDELNLAGKLPVKLGHATDDSAPAQGWITDIRMVDDTLVADISDVPDELYNAIKAGRYRFVSMELLRDVTKDGKFYRYVPDAIALLGAARPAVDSLKGLDKLVASARRGLTYKGAAVFSRELKRRTGSSVRTSNDDELGQLRAQNVALTQELVRSHFEQAISSKRILPRERERFFKRYGNEGTLEDAREWIKDSPRPDPKLFSREGGARVETEQSSSSSRMTFDRPDDEVTFRAEEIMKEEHAKGRTCDLFEATKLLFQRDRDLAQRYLNMPGDMWGNKR